MVDQIVSRLHAWRGRLWIVVVLIPMLILSAYYTLIATDRYYSVSKVVIQRAGDMGVQLGGINLPFIGMLGAGGKEDALQLMEYIHSPDMFARLEQKLQLRREFAEGGWDITDRLMPWATEEDVLALYRKRVHLLYDERSGVLTISTQFSSPARTQAINAAILSESERFLNELSHKTAREQLLFAQSQLEQAKSNLDAARDALLAFQNRHGVVDPAASLEASARLVHELQGQLAAKEVELNTLAAMLQDDAPQIQTLRQSIRSLKNQIEAERARLAAAGGTGMNRTAARYLELKALVDFHADLYKVALAATERLRVESARKIRSLAILAAPQQPDIARYPRHAPAVLAGWLLGLLVLYGLLRLALEIVEDHRD